MKDTYHGAMSDYIEDMAGVEAPRSVEREVMRAVYFDSAIFKYKGRGMELPDLWFSRLNRDDRGVYVPVEWGYPKGSYQVSTPVRFKDRRQIIIDAARALEMQRLGKEVRHLEDYSSIADPALKPSDLNDLFSQTAGSLQETQVKNPVIGKPEIELEIVGVSDFAQDTIGQFEFIAQGIIEPKPMPIAYIALAQVETRLALSPTSFMGRETVGSNIIAQNGIYRYIHFSSRTGRHSGWGYLSALPNK